MLYSKRQVANDLFNIATDASYLMNNIVTILTGFNVTSDRATNMAMFRYTDIVPKIRTSYLMLIDNNTNTNTVYICRCSPTENGYIYSSTALTTGHNYYLFGNIILD